MQELQEMWVQSLGHEDPLEEEITTHSSILAWEIPQRNLAGYSPWGHKESDITERLSLILLEMQVLGLNFGAGLCYTFQVA